MAKQLCKSSDGANTAKCQHVIMGNILFSAEVSQVFYGRLESTVCDRKVVNHTSDNGRIVHSKNNVTVINMTIIAKDRVIKMYLAHTMSDLSHGLEHA